MENVWLALIAGVLGVASPMLMAWLTNRHRRQEKQEDYKRQDEVAAKAAEAARLLLAANERVAANAKVTNAKLDVIHTLVNSNMTAAMQAELDARREGLAQMLEIIELKKAAGRDPNEQTTLAIGVAKGKIAELEASLADRLKQSKEIEKMKAH